jgi:hypothetical protein
MSNAHADHVVSHCNATFDCAAAAAGDVRLTRMVIFGALLGVLDPVLTLAAAEAAQGDVLRMPSEQMVAEREAAKSDNGNEVAGKGAWLSSARDMQWEKRVELAAGNSSDHAAVLAAFEVGPTCIVGLRLGSCLPAREQPAELRTGN